jgi:hypothetical protein
VVFGGESGVVWRVSWLIIDEPEDLKVYKL